MYTELSGKSKRDRNFIVYTLCLISLRKNLNRVPEIGFYSKDGAKKLNFLTSLRSQ
jgi:hypothetical protein